MNFEDDPFIVEDDLFDLDFDDGHFAEGIAPLKGHRASHLIKRKTPSERIAPRKKSSPHYLAALASGRFNNDHTVEAFAQEGMVEETTASLALLCELPFEVVERLMAHESAEMVHLLVRAAGLSWRSAKAILLLRAGGVPAHQLEECHARFARLKPDAARRFLKSFGSGSTGLQ
jgi:hypothetical protein